jgi:hypothetical protein
MGVTMILIKPEDAFLLFEKWMSEQTEIACTSEVFGWRASLRGRVVLVTADEASLRSQDGAGVLTVPFRNLEFAYAERRESRSPKGEDASRELVTLIANLPLRLRPSALAVGAVPPPREKLIFQELPKSPDI